ADGITSTALIVLALRSLHATVIPYIPDRIEEGYGLNTKAIDQIYEQGAKLLITVDNGIRSITEIDYANSLGLTVIVTDHHTPGDLLPAAAALINPKLPDDPYPNKNLAGVGVVYKLVQRLCDFFPELNPDQYLDLVAIGTIADMVPLSGENRYLVRQGLTQINHSPRQGLSSLIGVANMLNRKIITSDISYQIGPRINSSGRLDTESAYTPLNLLISSDPAESGLLAQIVENHNAKRKAFTRKLEEKIDVYLLKFDPLPSAIIILEDDIYLGVAGIAAGNLCRKYNSPAVVGQIGKDFTTASCRSIPAFNIIEALDSCQNLFTHYGGHALAAGFTIANKNLSKLREHLKSLADEKLDGLDLRPFLKIDATVNFQDLHEKLHRELQKLEPTGEKNQVPVLVARNLKATQVKRIGKENNHLKFNVSDGKYSFEAIGFGLGEYAEIMPERFDLAFNLTINEYRGVRDFQLRILDFKLS
ncbi:MAG: single-stranded-DNA-specific exonuclease RecJ, partial [Anaerolineales bacterium]|nr:single-stranded-DNA-specific exonuclease RecJ [Anaerolineales bacterium]